MDFVNEETGEIFFDAYEVIQVNLYHKFKNDYYVSPSEATSDKILREQCLFVDEDASRAPYIKFALYQKALKKDYDVVVKLASKIKYRNIIFLDIPDLCHIFGLSDNKNLDRKLKALSKRNIIQYSKVSRSQYKVFVNPRIFYRGDKRTYMALCAKSEWDLDGKPQAAKQLIVENDTVVSEITAEKQLLWEAQDDRVNKILEDLGYKHEDDYEKCVGRSRKNKVLNCNMQKFYSLRNI